MTKIKLSEAMDTLRTIRMSWGLIEKTTQHPWKGEAIELHLITGGESRNEHFLGLLQDSFFGSRYWASYSRGGLFIYIIPLKDFEDEEPKDWFALFNPNHLAGIVEPFYMFENDEYKIVTKTYERLEYERVTV